ncbi:hypothetical protein [Priestia megaterium]|nr:hypothetical protein [Priestia megaterium]
MPYFFLIILHILTESVDKISF